ncbi:glycosyltransferase family 2 protein [Limnoglobus roseus]|uniref:GT2 family glycosyltransferase n=1 Tax=Limnoglobus roseus TaxID=2598579 RepID=A0A5C1AR20_9BACT|nr:glycosyltransferase family 2 protein [Limnoglobus roseus]QEL20182.1 GT2 family glycosyltransferase [Limnoglobus roseus]
MKLSLIVPCYNEKPNLPRLLERFRTVVGSRPDVEVILVDNGSTDGSAEVFAEELAKPQNRFARMVRVPVNRGYGFGITSGLRAVRGEFLGWTHADLQTDPNDLMVGFDKLQAEPDAEHCFLRGRRIGRNFFDALFTGGMSLVASAALGTWLNDINAQPKMFHRSFFESLTTPPDDFALDLYVLYSAKKAGLKVIELPVVFAKREAGEAKGGGSLRGKYKLTKRTFRYILALRRGLSLNPIPVKARAVVHGRGD